MVTPMHDGVRVWLDDHRNPNLSSPWCVDVEAPWVWVTTAAEAIALLETGTVIEMSLDYDLSATDSTGATGADVLRWIVESGVWPPHVYVHSIHPNAFREMQPLLALRP
jgi:hypothetical protein